MYVRKVLILLVLSLVSVLALTTSESQDVLKETDGYSAENGEEIVQVLLEDTGVYLESSDQGQSTVNDMERVNVYDTDVDGDKNSAWRRSLMAKGEEDCRRPKKTEEKNCRKPRAPAPPPPPRSPPPPPPSPEEEYVYNPPYRPDDTVPVLEPSPPPQLINAPPPPPRENMCTQYTPRRKILSGPRVVPDGGLRACTGLHVSGPSACCQICQQTAACAGWMYTRPLDCRQFGMIEPQNVCYMVSEVTGSYDPILGGMEYASATATY
jgi:hypothetical protein